MMLSEHFSLAEMTISQTAARKGLNNTPNAATLENLKKAAAMMEKVRDLLDKPIIVNSAYRSVAVNKAIGGVATSAHCAGLAVDFICTAYGTPLEVARAIARSKLNFDQLIEENGQWVHISVDPRMRRQVLTMRKGKYTEGLQG